MAERVYIRLAFLFFIIYKKGWFVFMKIKVTGERYLIKQYLKKGTKGGVFIPSTSQDERMQGVIIEMGQGALLSNAGDSCPERAPMFCEIGDTVLFTKFSGTPIGLLDENGKKDETFLMVNQRDLLAIVKLGEDNKTYVIPLGERYIVKQYKPETKTASGIVIPGKAAETRFQGSVCAASRGICMENGKFTPMLYEIGQSVLFSKFAGTPIRLNSGDNPEELLILNQRDIVCVIEN
jgi:chaperonin GroES